MALTSSVWTISAAPISRSKSSPIRFQIAVPQKPSDQSPRVFTKFMTLDFFHRELKPGNIMIDSRNHVSILGVAAAAFIPQNSIGAAINEMAFGTVDYLSPEQVVDRGFISVESEIGLLAPSFTIAWLDNHRFVPATTKERSHEF